MECICRFVHFIDLKALTGKPNPPLMVAEVTAPRIGEGNVLRVRLHNTLIC